MAEFAIATRRKFFPLDLRGLWEFLLCLVVAQFGLRVAPVKREISHAAEVRRVSDDGSREGNKSR